MTDHAESREPASDPSSPSPSDAPTSSDSPPGRYRRVERGEPSQSLIVCGNAPNIFLRVERGLSVTGSGRKRFDRQTIFLDGVFNEAPFYDNDARQYSLDHHAECVRAFTLATCEQAVVMLLQGLPLAEEDWHVYINDPDFDALLAAWVLFNHVELLREEREMLKRAMPFIRVAGVIDAHGFDMGVLAAQRDVVYERIKTRIDNLLGEERRLKSEGKWGEVDLVDYSAMMLAAIDEVLFPEGYLDSLRELVELKRVTLEQGKLGILCRSQQGIYAVEARLKERYGKTVGVIALDQGGGRFTLRQTDPFLPKRMNEVYKRLNKKDPNVGGSTKDENTWGGSDDIGGSPRATGTALDGDAVIGAIMRVYGKPGFWRRILKR